MRLHGVLVMHPETSSSSWLRPHLGFFWRQNLLAPKTWSEKTKINIVINISLNNIIKTTCTAVVMNIITPNMH